MTRRLSIAVLTVFLAGVASLVAMTGRGRSRPADESRATTDSASPSSLAAHAQAVDTAVSAPPRRPVMLGREGDEPSAPLVLESARYEVTVAGFAARTRATLTFRNDAGRVLEGEFVYPLPDTAVISGFALDVGGRMVDGVVVEAQQARIAFDTEVRKGIDPGLVEWVRGNTFRTRIWPLPARGRRTVTIEYISELAEHAATDGLDVSYELPLRFDVALEALALRVEVVRTDLRPVVRSGPADLAFSQWQDRYVAEASSRNVRPDDLVITLPRVPRDTVVVEADPGGETYFTVDDIPDVPRPSAGAMQTPSLIAVLWDASLSRERADRVRDLRLLAAHLARLGDVTVRAVVFRNVPDAPRDFTIRRGNAAALIDYLRGQPCDGATNLAAIAQPANVEYALLFTDGLWTLGSRPSWMATRPLYAISGSSDADHALLSSLAVASGGAHINLQRHSDSQALDRIGRPVFSLLGVEATTGVADIEPRGAQPVAGRVTIAGRLLAPAATLRLRYGVAGGDEVVKTVELRRGTTTSTGIAARRWAHRRVASLSLDARTNHEELVAIGQRFSIVTPGTSLLVLERFEQYLEHRVMPPASLPDLRARYEAHVRQAASDEKGKKASHLRNVLAMWERRVAWWTRTFEVKPGFRYAEPPAARGSQRGRPGAAGGAPDRGVSGVVGGIVGGVPDSPPPPPLPAPVGAAPTEAPGQAEMVAVEAAQAAPAGGNAATIAVAAWNPDTPYLRALDNAAPSRAYATYLDERARAGTSPAFFLDCADFFARRGERALAIRILTSVAELRLEDARLLRVLAHRLEQVEEVDLAIEIFEHVQRLRPEEPQSFRDLALALDRQAALLQGTATTPVPSAMARYGRALELLGDVVMGEWDQRFPEVQVIALEEANRIADAMLRRGVDAWPLDAQLRRLLDVDIRIVLTWDTDLTDMDLWVLEPSGEKCFYSHALTTIGGAITRDFTGGLGPEVYAVRRAMAGEYRIQANFYGSRAQTLTGPTTLQAVVITHYGRPDEQRRSLTLRLTGSKDVVDVGAVTFAK